MRTTICCVGFMLATVFTAISRTAVDQHTTFMASFDESIEPDYCAGDWRAVTRGRAELTRGKLGNAVSLQPREGLSYGADGRINLASGTIEFWLLWTDEIRQLGKAHIMGFVTPEQRNYVNFNRISTNRLGMPMRGGPVDDFKWQRVDVDPSAWAPGSWHHIAGTWTDGVTRLYVDGELVEQHEGGANLIEAPEALGIGPGPLVIDELRISSIARSADEISAAASAKGGTASSLYLTKLDTTNHAQSVSKVGIDTQTAIDDRKTPLVIGRRAYARGVALRPSGFVEFSLPEGFTRLVGTVGLSPFSRREASATLMISLDGRRVLEEAGLKAEDGATTMDVPVQGGRVLRIEAHADQDLLGAVIIVGDALLLTPNTTPPPSFSRLMSKDDLTLQRMRTKVADLSFDVSEAVEGYVVYAGHPVDEVDPAVEPLNDRCPGTLALRAAPGEYEAAQFTLCAARDIASVTVSAGQLIGPTGVIPKSRMNIHLVRRVLQRKGYWMPRRPSNYDVVSRFLFPNRNFWLPAGSFKEVYILIHVPREATPGDYTSSVRIAPTGLEPTDVQLRLTVDPVELVQPRTKRYGMYYRMHSVIGKPDAMHAEFADLAAHGCTMLKGHASIEFSRDENGHVAWDFDLIRAMLEGGRAHGFHGPITIYDNLMRLTQVMGYRGLDKEGKGQPVSDEPEVLSAARTCFAELKQLNAEYPEYEFLLTHMDEVFGRGRLARYIDYAQIIRKTSDFRIYITMHTKPGGWEKYIEQADPYIDVRCHNGHSLETWLHAGHTWADMAELLTEAGDKGWMYHNMRGSFFKAEWNRFINGLFMWVSPLEVHVPWMYYSYAGDPFDDTDSDHHDFVYAVPDPEAPERLVSTLHWEAFREGYDDMRYIATLEQAMAGRRAQGVDVSAAEAWLAQLRSILPQLPDDILESNQESPYTVAATRRLSGADYDTLRALTAQHIIRLQSGHAASPVPTPGPRAGTELVTDVRWSSLPAEVSPEPDLSQRKTIAIPKLRSAPVLDGELNDLAWKDAAETDSWMVNTGEAPAPAQTKAWLGTFGDRLFVGVRANEPKIEGIVARVTDDAGPVWDDDCIELFMDGDLDLATARQLVINAAGAVATLERGGSWTPDVERAARIGHNAWSVEFSLPLRDLGLTGSDFGLNLCRERRAAGGNRLSCWTPTGGGFLQPSKFGLATLQGGCIRSLTVSKGMLGRNELTVTVANPDEHERTLTGTLVVSQTGEPPAAVQENTDRLRPGQPQQLTFGYRIVQAGTPVQLDLTITDEHGKTRARQQATQAVADVLYMAVSRRVFTRSLRQVAVRGILQVTDELLKHSRLSLAVLDANGQEVAEKTLSPANRTMRADLLLPELNPGDYALRLAVSDTRGEQPRQIAAKRTLLHVLLSP